MLEENTDSARGRERPWAVWTAKGKPSGGEGEEEVGVKDAES